MKADILDFAARFTKTPLEQCRLDNDAVICGKVDLLLSGHDHSRQWLTETCRGTELVVSGTGAEGTELPGHEPTHYQSIGLGFVYVVVDGGRLVAEFVDDEARTEYTHTLTKT